MSRPLLSSTLTLVLAATAASAQTASTAGGTGPDGSGTKQSAQTVDGRQPRSVAAQNHELDQIGRKLLNDTPKNSPNSEAATGGGLEPPKH